MQIRPLSAADNHAVGSGKNPSKPAASQAEFAPAIDAALVNQNAEQPEPDKMRELFHDFVGQTFFGEMIKAYRSTQQPSAYFHGGRAEEIFQSQFDQQMAEQLSEASVEKIADPMYELFKLGRSS